MTLKTDEYFPLQFKYVAYFFLIVSIPLIIEVSLIWGPLVFLLSLTVITTRYEFEVNKDEHFYREYVRILWLKNGKKKQYSSAEYCFITASKYIQRMQLKAANTDFEGVEYNGYIKFSENEKIHIARRTDKEQLLKPLRKLANYLDLEIVDHSTED